MSKHLQINAVVAGPDSNVIHTGDFTNVVNVRWNIQKSRNNEGEK